MVERSIETKQRLAALGLQLPEMTAPLAAYVPAKLDQSTGTIYVSGQLPMLDQKLLATGVIGEEETSFAKRVASLATRTVLGRQRPISLERGQSLAEQTALNVLAAIDSVADLDGIEILKVEAFVASARGFDKQHLVANAASELFREALGERGKHARVALAHPQLPLNSPIEISATARRLPVKNAR